MKLRNSLTKKLLAGSLSAALVLSSAFVSAPLTTAAGSEQEQPKLQTDKWIKSISIDFGIRDEINGVSSKVPVAKTNDDGTVKLPQLIPNAAGYEDYADSVGDIIQCNGTMLYESTTVQDLYGVSEDIGIKQQIGFDKVLPAAITSGGEYFNDWVFSPDGEAYKFSCDLVPGQYYVCVYTGNKLKEKSNTTFVNFNDEKAAGSTILYDQTSIGGQQFYGPEGNKVVTKDNKYIYSVDVQDNGKGFGTLVLNLSDPKLTDSAYEASHTLKVSDAIKSIEDYNNLSDEEKANYSESANPRIKAIDCYTGDECEINQSEIADKLVTARLNGIEIVPVKQMKHITSEALNSIPAKMSFEMGSESKMLLENLADYTDRIVFGSSNPSVASVNVYTGEVTPVGVGTAKVSAYSGYWAASVSTDVTVTPETVVSLDKSAAKLMLDSGDDAAKTTLTATFNVASEDVIEWSVDKSDVIEIEKDKFTAGDPDSTCTINVKALKAGSATITATRKDTNKTAKCTINVVKPIKSFEITKEDGTVIAADSTLNMYTSDALTIKTKVTPEDASDKSIQYITSDRSVASISEKGDGALISANGVGEATITCTAVSNPDAVVTFKVVVAAKPEEKPADNNNGNNTNNNTNNGTAPSASPAPSPAAVSTAAPTTGAENDNDEVETVSIKLTGKAKATIKVKKSATFKASVTGSSIAKITCKIKSGKKFIKVKVVKNKQVKITAKKKGTAKLIITVKAKDGTTKKFTRTITVKK